MARASCGAHSRQMALQQPQIEHQVDPVPPHQRSRGEIVQHSREYTVDRVRYWSLVAGRSTTLPPGLLFVFVFVFFFVLVSASASVSDVTLKS